MKATQEKDKMGRELIEDRKKEDELMEERKVEDERNK